MRVRWAIRLCQKKFKKRATAKGWAKSGGILDIPDLDDPPITHDLLKLYGSILLKEVFEHSNTYSKTHTYQAQNSVVLAEAIQESLTEEGSNKIDLIKHSYIEDNIAMGTVLFRIIIQESHVDTATSTFPIRQKLAQVGHNVTKMNMRVRLLLNNLEARKEKMADLIPNFF